MAGIDLYQTLGGRETCRKLATAFYARVARDPVLRPLFPGKTFKCAIDEFAAFLAQFLGGPAEDTQHRWWLSLRESHLRFKIGAREREAWMGHMVKALDDVKIEEPLRGALRGFFEQSSAYVVNTGPAPAAEAVLHGEISKRWDAQRALDRAVAAIREGNAALAVELAEGLSASTALLAAMIGSGHTEILAYVCGRLSADPALAHERYSRGRTLLHAAAAAGSLAIVELLIRLGADPCTTDAGCHTPLYCVGNECLEGDGGGVVRALVQAGANVDACDGVQRCTALHMAARRGNVEVAASLLDCGANIEARDRSGDTPLRRAVNCDKTELAMLLVARGADGQREGGIVQWPVPAGVLEQLLVLIASRRAAQNRDVGAIL